MNNPWYRKPRELREESQEGRIVAGKERKGLAAAVNVFFSMVGSLVWIKVWTGGTKGCGGKKRTHKDTIRWRRIAGILWFLYLLIPFLSSGLSAPCWPVIRKKAFIFSSLTWLLCWFLGPELISDWVAERLIDSWLSSMPLYLFQSWPFTFPAILLIYLDTSFVYKHKSATLKSCAILARAEQLPQSL